MSMKAIFLASSWMKSLSVWSRGSFRRFEILGFSPLLQMIVILFLYSPNLSQRQVTREPIRMFMNTSWVSTTDVHSCQSAGATVVTEDGPQYLCTAADVLTPGKVALVSFSLPFSFSCLPPFDLGWFHMNLLVGLQISSPRYLFGFKFSDMWLS